jgi:hypothetical protein
MGDPSTSANHGRIASKAASASAELSQRLTVNASAWSVRAQ